MGKTRRQDDPFVRQVVSKRKGRARVYTEMRIGNGHKLPPSPAGAMCCSPLQTISAARHRQARAWVDIYMGMSEDWEWAQAATKSCGRDVRLPTADDHHCSTPTKGRLCQVRASHVAKQVERHHFLLANRCAIITFFSTFRLFSILNPRASYLPTPTHSFDIQTMSSLNKTHLIHRSVYSQGIHTSSLQHRCRPDLDLRRKEARRAWNLGAIEQDGTRAEDVLIGRYVGWMDGWIAVALRG